MKSVEFLGNRLSLDGVDKASRDIPIGELAMAFRDYVYGFLQLNGWKIIGACYGRQKEEKE